MRHQGERISAEWARLKNERGELVDRLIVAGRVVLGPESAKPLDAHDNEALTAAMSEFRASIPKPPASQSPTQQKKLDDEYEARVKSAAHAHVVAAANAERERVAVAFIDGRLGSWLRETHEPLDVREMTLQRKADRAALEFTWLFEPKE